MPKVYYKNHKDLCCQHNYTPIIALEGVYVLQQYTHPHYAVRMYILYYIYAYTSKCVSIHKYL